MLDYILYFFGILFLIKVFLPLFRIIKIYKLSPKTDYKKYGAGSSWAVVTGASDGIGKAFAEDLAKRGFNIVLIARNQQKLDEVAESIKKTTSKETKTIVIDFSNATNSDYDKISAQLNGLDIGILVNNVGLSYEYPDFFLNVDLKRLNDLIAINASAQVNVTYRILPMLEKRGRSLVLNISSISGCTPTPLLAVYSATKSFMNVFSQTLYSEYRSKGIHIECLAPAFVVSKMSKRSKPSLQIPLPEVYVKQALNTVGQTSLRAGYFIHDLIIFAISLVPSDFLLQKNKEMHLGIRSAALKKIEREKQSKKE